MKKTETKPRQLMLFGMDNAKEIEADEKAKTLKGKTDTSHSDPNLWHRIARITPDGERHWEASMDARFSVLYAMQLYYCQTHRMNFYYKPHLRKARERLTIGKTDRTVFFEEDGDVFILEAEKGKSVLEGIAGSKYEHDLRVP